MPRVLDDARGQIVARGVGSTLLALVIAVAAASAGSRTAEAHAFLVRTAPAAGERLGSSPSVIQFQFSQPIASLQGLGLRTRDGRRVAIGRPEAAQGGNVAQTQVPPLGAGVYLVSWQVVATDGHVSVGEFAFAVGAASGPVPVATSAAGHDVSLAGRDHRHLGDRRADATLERRYGPAPGALASAARGPDAGGCGRSGDAGRAHGGVL